MSRCECYIEQKLDDNLEIDLLIANRLLISRGGGRAVRGFFNFGPDTSPASPSKSALRFTPFPNDPCPPRVPLALPDRP